MNESECERKLADGWGMPSRKARQYAPLLKKTIDEVLKIKRKVKESKTDNITEPLSEYKEE